MDAETFVSELRRRDVSLQVDAHGGLRVNAPKGVVVGKVDVYLRRYKPEILAVLRADDKRQRLIAVLLSCLSCAQWRTPAEIAQRLRDVPDIDAEERTVIFAELLESGCIECQQQGEMRQWRRVEELPDPFEDVLDSELVEPFRDLLAAALDNELPRVSVPVDGVGTFSNPNSAAVRAGKELVRLHREGKGNTDEALRHLRTLSVLSAWFDAQAAEATEPAVHDEPGALCPPHTLPPSGWRKVNEILISEWQIWHHAEEIAARLNQPCSDHIAAALEWLHTDARMLDRQEVPSRKAMAVRGREIIEVEAVYYRVRPDWAEENNLNVPD